MDDRSVDRETVERTKGKLMQKAADKRAESERSTGGGGDSGVARARKRFEENRRLQGAE
jgi:hypothetical protein